MTSLQWQVYNDKFTITSLQLQVWHIRTWGLEIEGDQLASSIPENLKTEKIKSQIFKGKKPGLVVRAEDSRPEGRQFKSCRILDGCKRCQLLHIQWKKKKKKVAKWGTPKNIFFK